MQRFIHHSTWRAALTAVAVALVAQGCTVYEPLDRGSGVPWAKTHQAGAERKVTARSDRVPTQASGERYRVRRGDRLSALAEANGVSVAQLAQANGLEAPYVIYVGQELRIPGTGVGGSSRSTKPKAVAKVAPAPAPPKLVELPPGERYAVRKGETLTRIARHFDVPVVQLAALNQIGPPYDVYAGQKLRIPSAGERSEPVKSTKVKASSRSKAKPAPQFAKGKVPPLSGEGFLWPANGKVIGGFGAIGNKGERRDGVDIAARKGAPVVAAENGLVAYADDGIRSYGRMILLRHASGYVTTYAHNAALLVEVGEVVHRGQVIARVGATGDVTRSQLHFELRKGRKPINPETVLVRAAGTTEVASRQ